MILMKNPIKLVLISFFVWTLCSYAQTVPSDNFNGGLIIESFDVVSEEVLFYNAFQTEIYRQPTFVSTENAQTDPKITSPNYSFIDVSVENGSLKILRSHDDWITKKGSQVFIGYSKDYETIEPFNVLGVSDHLINTQNVKLTWEISTVNTVVDFQQVLKLSTQNYWDVFLDNISPDVSSVTLNTQGGRFVVRKVNYDGFFIDNDDESSLVLSGKGRKQTTIEVDLISPEWESIPALVLDEALGIDMYVTSLAISEKSKLYFEVRDENDLVFYETVIELDEAPVTFSWTTISSQNLKIDGLYNYSFLSEDMAGNSSERVTGNLFLDRVSPELTVILDPEYGLFSPNEDTVNDILDIQVTVNEVSQLRVTLFSPSMDIVVSDTQFEVTSNFMTLTASDFVDQVDGLYTLFTEAEDLHGLKTGRTQNITIDRQAPVIATLNSISIGANQDNYPLTLTSSEGGFLQLVYSNFESTQNIESGETVVWLLSEYLEDGLADIPIYLRDLAGNLSVATQSVLVDRYAPELTSITALSTVNLTVNTPFSVQVTDNFTDQLNSTLTLQNESAQYTLGEYKTTDFTVTLNTLIQSQTTGLETGDYDLVLSVEDSLKNTLVTTQNISVRSSDPVFIIQDLTLHSFLVNPFLNLTGSVTHGHLGTIDELTVSLKNISELGDIYVSENMTLGDYSFTWDGTLNNLLIDDGTYDLVYKVRDVFGVESDYTQKVYIDHQVPVIVSFTETHNPFNFLNSYTLQMDVEDTSLEMDRAELYFDDTLLVSDDFSKSNVLSLSFDGLVESQSLADGSYDFFLRVYDKAGNTVTQSVTFEVDTSSPNIETMIVSNSLFSPDGDGVSDNTTITLEASEPVKATLTVTDFSGDTFRTIQTDEYQSSITLDWDGMSDSLEVWDGDYTYVVELEDRAGNSVQTSSQELVVFRQHEGINNIAVSSQFIQSGSDWYLGFDVSDYGMVSGFVSTIYDDPLKTITPLSELTLNDNSLYWDGTDDLGVAVADGNYKIRLYFTNQKGYQFETPVDVYVEVDNSSPVLTQNGFDVPVLVWPDMTTLSLPFVLSERVTLDMKLLSETGAELSVLETQTFSYSDTEMTLDLDSEHLGVGTYSTAMTLTDQAGNQSEHQVSFFVANGDMPTITVDKDVVLFSPDGDAVSDELIVNTVLSGTIENNLDVFIKDASGVVIKTIKDTEIVGTGNLVLEWDGRDSTNSLVADGVYMMDVVLEDVLSQRVTQSVSVFVNRSSIALSFDYPSTYVSFNGDGVQDELSVTINVEYPVGLKDDLLIDQVAILNWEAVQLDTVVSSGQQTITTAGEFSELTLPVINGDFEIQFSGEGFQGHKLSSETLTFLHDDYIASTADVQLFVSGESVPKTLFNTTLIDVDIVIDGSETISLYDDLGVLVSSVDTEDGHVLLTQLSISEGAHTFSVEASDKSGNSMSSQTLDFVIDVSIQTPFISGFSSFQTSSNVDVLIGSDLGSTVNVFVDDALYSTYLHTSEFETVSIVFSDGVHLISLLSEDSAGNESVTSNFSFLVDTLDPTVDSQSIVNTAAISHDLVTVNVTFSEAVTYLPTLIVDGLTLFPVSNLTQSTVPISGSLGENSMVFSVPIDVQGTALLHLNSIQDLAGNTIESVSSLSFAVDSVYPEISQFSTAVTTNYSVFSDYSVSVTFSEPISESLFSVEIQSQTDGTVFNPESVVFNDTFDTAELLFSLPLVDDDFELVLTGIEDTFENSLMTQTVDLGLVDNIPPEIIGLGASKSTFSAYTLVEDDNISVTMSISEDYSRLLIQIVDKDSVLQKVLLDSNGEGGLAGLGDVQLNWDGKDDSGVPLSVGWYVLNGWVIDLNGNKSLLEQGLFEITEEHLLLSDAVSLDIPHSFIVTPTLNFTYSLSELIATPDIDEMPDVIRLNLIQKTIGTITEKIYKVDGVEGVLIKTLSDLKPISAFTNSDTPWDGRLESSVLVESGEYYFEVKAYALNENRFQDQARIYFTIDNDSPEISNVVIPSLLFSQLSNLHTVTVNADVFDAQSTQNLSAMVALSGLGISAQSNGLTNGGHSFVIDLTSTANGVDGNYEHLFLVQDEAGNSTSINTTIVLDNTPPSVEWSIPSLNHFVSGSVTVETAVINDVHPISVLYQFGAQSFQEVSVFDSSALNQDLVVTLKVTDTAGNSFIESRTVVADNEIQLPSFEAATLWSNLRELSLNSIAYTEPNPDLLYIRIGESNEWHSVVPTDHITIELPDADAVYTVAMKLVDGAGNVSGIFTKDIELDRVAPVLNDVQFVHSQARYEADVNQYYIGNYPISVDHTTPELKEQWSALYEDQEKDSDSELIFNINDNSSFVEGENTVYLTAHDLAGNVSNQVGPLVISVDTVAPVISTLSIQARNDWIGLTEPAYLDLSYDEVNLESIRYEISDTDGTLQSTGTLGFYDYPLGINDLFNTLNGGDYTFDIYLTDYVGQVSQETLSVQYDPILPTIKDNELVVFPDDVNIHDRYVSSTLVMLDTFSGFEKIEFMLKKRDENGNFVESVWEDEITLASGSRYWFHTTSHDEGLYKISLKLTDRSGNTNELNYDTPIEFDFTPVELTGFELEGKLNSTLKDSVLYVAPNENGNLKVVPASSEQGVSYKIILTEVGGELRTTSKNLESSMEFYMNTLLDDQSAISARWNIELMAMDDARNVTRLYKSLFIDQIEPVISTTILTNDRTSTNVEFTTVSIDPLYINFDKDSVEYVITVPDGTGSVSYLVNLTKFGDVVPLFTKKTESSSNAWNLRNISSLGEGTYSFTAYVRDLAGNESEKKIITVTNDKTNPEVNLLGRIGDDEDGHRSSAVTNEMIMKINPYEDEEGDAFVIIGYTVSDNNTYVTNNARIFGEESLGGININLINSDLGGEDETFNNKFRENIQWNGMVEGEVDTGDDTTTVQAPEGVYFWEVVATDLAGNVDSVSFPFYLAWEQLAYDSSGPSAPNSNPETHSISLELEQKSLVSDQVTIKFGLGDREQAFSQMDVFGDDSRGSRKFVVDVTQNVTKTHSSVISRYMFSHWGDIPYDGDGWVVDYPWYIQESGSFVDQGPGLIPSLTYLKTRRGYSFSTVTYELSPGYYYHYTRNEYGIGYHKVEMDYYSEGYKRIPVSTSTGLIDSVADAPEATYDYMADNDDSWGKDRSSSSASFELTKAIVPLTNASSYPDDIEFLYENSRVYLKTNNKTFQLSDRRQGLIGYLNKDEETGIHSFTQTETAETVDYIYPYLKDKRKTNSSVDTGEITSVISEFTAYKQVAGSSYNIAWIDLRNNKTDIYYTKLNLGSLYGVDGTPIQTFFKIIADPSTFNLVYPITEKEDDITVITTSTPSFSWRVPTDNLTDDTQFQIQLVKGIVLGQSELSTFNVSHSDFDNNYYLLDVSKGAYKKTDSLISFKPDKYNSLSKTENGEVYRWQVIADWDGNGSYDDTTVSSEVFYLDPPLGIEVSLNYPNPFKRHTRIRYKLSKDARSVYIRIFDIAGKPVRTLRSSPTDGTSLSAEYNDVLWDGKNGVGVEVNNGVYIYKIIAKDEDGHKVTARGKMVKLR
jgi:flagellar hook assembly protein FlgD